MTRFEEGQGKQIPDTVFSFSAAPHLIEITPASEPIGDSPVAEDRNRQLPGNHTYTAVVITVGVSKEEKPEIHWIKSSDFTASEELSSAEAVIDGERKIA
jgi:hypothetical protein